MNTILKEVEKTFREFILERVTQRMNRDVDRCLITDTKANFKIYEQKEKLDILVHPCSVAEFDALYDRLAEMVDDKQSTISYTVFFQGEWNGSNIRFIYLFGSKSRNMLHTIIILDENNSAGKEHRRFSLDRINKNYQRPVDMPSGKEQCQPCL